VYSSFAITWSKMTAPPVAIGPGEKIRSAMNRWLVRSWRTFCTRAGFCRNASTVIRHAWTVGNAGGK
jgi:hypothetical protein